MPATSRITDLCAGTCNCHKSTKSVTGIIITGSADHFIEGPGVALIGSVAVCSCGHVVSVVTGKPTNLTNGLSKAEIGSIAVGCPICTVITGAATAS